MAKEHEEEAARLARVVAKHIEVGGGEILEKHERALRLAVAWLGYLRGAQARGTADVLLDGFHAALIEAAGCLATGFVRPAVFAMRAQVDILLAWMYFRDHRVEWQYVEETGEKYKYLRTYDRRFGRRLALLRGRRTGGTEDPYRLLSAHVHGQNSATVPRLVRVPKLVRSRTVCLDCIVLQKDVCEYLSDVLTARFAGQWADLPGCVTQAIEGRLDAAGLRELCRS